MFHCHVASTIEDKHELLIEKLFLLVPLSIKDDFEFSWLVLELLSLSVVKNVALYPNPLTSLQFSLPYKIQSLAETMFP